MDARARLERARDEQVIVTVRRDLRYADRVDGFVVDIGRRWVLLRGAFDSGRPDGWTALRIKDVTKVRRWRNHFSNGIARSLPSWPPAPPWKIDLETRTGMLWSMASGGRLVAFYCDDWRDALWCASIHEVRRRWFVVQAVTPTATWNEPEEFRKASVTRVDVGTGYLTALESVTPAEPPLRLRTKA